MPTIGDPQAVADGALFTGEGLDPLDTPGDVVGESALVVRFRAGADVTTEAARLASLRGIGTPGEPGVSRPSVPLEIERLQQISRVPLALASFLTILGAVAVGHLLVTSVQRRRRDFAVLKSLGFRRSRVSATVGAQATTVAGVGAVVGLVTGSVVGIALWRDSRKRRAASRCRGPVRRARRRRARHGRDRERRGGFSPREPRRGRSRLRSSEASDAPSTVVGQRRTHDGRAVAREDFRTMQSCRMRCDMLTRCACRDVGPDGGNGRER